MKIIKIGAWDKNGMPIRWTIDCNKPVQLNPSGAVMTIDQDGKVFVDRVEIVPWTEKRRKAMYLSKEEK